ncbi:hypothetical protein [Psychromonas ossibalaenae]|uniref:hypothetical protein n=1 Tax=Psychromonas ossibalaenae TaxID=444922 RepID=UPI00037E22E2|nr:hypothetical protein [Psychromonas ossibalaenae]
MKELKYLKRTLKVLLIVSFGFLLSQQAGAACRNLVETDPYYSGWTYCCDLDTSVGHSYWIKRGGNGEKIRYTGSCESWGIKAVPAKSVCRDLRQGDPYFSGWRRCCDEGSKQSRWFKRFGGDNKGALYSGDCRHWGINP